MPTPEEIRAIEERTLQLTREKEERENKPPLSPEIIEAILQKIRELGLGSAHYVGNCDRGLVESLSTQLGKRNVSVMDMTGRFPVIILDEEDFPPGYEQEKRPDWMRGIDAYFEGAPLSVDLVIDERNTQIFPEGSWIRPSYRKPARLYAFIGPAMGVERLPGFDWSESRGVVFAKASEDC